RRVRAFLEFDVRGTGRGSVEYGIDSMLNPDEPLYLRIHGPDGSTKPVTFSDIPDYLKRRDNTGGGGQDGGGGAVPTGIRAASENPRGPGRTVTPFHLRPRELQRLTEAKLRQPVPNLEGKVHPYRNQDDYEFRYRSDSGNSGPAPTSYIVNDTGEIHLSP